MNNKVDKFFMSDRLLYAMPWFFAVSVIAYQILANIATWYFGRKDLFYVFDFMLDIMLIFLVIGVAVSYKVHEKNITKMLFGAVLMERVIYATYWVSATFVDGYSNNVDIVFAIAFLCLYILLFISHLILGYGHKSNPDRTKFNRIIALLILLAVTIWDLWDIDGINPFVSYVFDIIYEATILIEILCIETKVDAYKVIRENNSKI